MTYSSDIAAERIAALINSRPRSPTISEMATIIAEAQTETAEAELWPADKIETEIRETIAEYQALVDARCQQVDQFDKLEDRINALEQQLPERPRTVSNLISRAELAWVWSDKEADGTMTALDADCDRGVDDAAVARLIVAVLQFAGLGKRYKVEA